MQTTDTQTTTTIEPTQEGLYGFCVSAAAAKRIRQLAEAEGTPGMRLRVQVLSGGCSGFQYKFELDDTINDDDKILTAIDDAPGTAPTVVVDDMSLPFLENAMLDFREELIGSFFAITNPNASSTCGCGTSFSM